MGSGEEMATTQFGSGGGFSYDYDMPSYQSSAVKAYLAKSPKTGSDSYATNGRGSPDVSLLGEQFEVYTSGPFGGLEKVAVGWEAVTGLGTPKFTSLQTVVR